ncbi:hypothetical protein D0Z70_03070 [Sphingobium terrigena]|uniref:Uncharacterized protein n=1 Tax=Sphingobium terrigena TaxID=2304063 RepID=A0A418YX56_9SPHN|nr:hypothetical protein [Sphingobium terrigena]RJG57210.1 hypothetical protein D0Z70_03070 [Sphingobium terrigena]
MATGVSVDALVNTIENSEARGAAIRLLLDLYRLGHDLVVSVSNPKKDVHFLNDQGVRPYSFIANKTDLLFYFRKHARKPDASFTLPLERSTEDEATYRIANEQNALEIVKFISQNRE